MKHLVFIFLILHTSVFALSQFQSSQVCKKCHPLIYKEHYASQHRKASIFNDPIHKSVWEKHPLHKKYKYKCAKCHTPNDSRVIDALKTTKHAEPKENKAQEEGVSCVSCHNIQSIEKHTVSNKNIITNNKKVLFSARKSEKDTSDKQYKTKKSLFGFVTQKSGSPFHDINFTNELYYNGNVCMGCHSHKENEHKLTVCKTLDKAHSNSEKENCITCHMPMVEGSFSTIIQSKMHRYHGFTGTIHQPKMLLKYVDITFEKTNDGFDIKIKNKANHALLLHPLRVGELRVDLHRKNQVFPLKTQKFMRLIGKNNHPTPPWVATEVIKNTQIQAKEIRIIHYNTSIKKGDEIVVTLGYYIITPKAAKKLNIAEGKLSKFKIFKQEIFHVE